jgi:hypothetical protein
LPHVPQLPHAKALFVDNSLCVASVVAVRNYGAIGFEV